jgi:hypothetical protein
MSTFSPTAPPAGWYPDPAVAGAQRWWDGAAWTEHVAPLTYGPARHGLEPIDLIVPRPHTFGPRGLIWGIIAFILPMAILPAVLALVFSISAIVRARRIQAQGQPVAIAMPVAGLILGAVSLVGFVLIVSALSVLSN